MKMLKKIFVKNYRCLEDLSISDLGRINLMIGDNNVGKTSLLEALWLYHGCNNASNPIKIARFRGVSGLIHNEFRDLFSKFDDKRNIVLSENGTKNGIRLEIFIKEQTISSMSLEDGAVETDTSSDDQATLNEIYFKYIDNTGRSEESKAFVKKDQIHFKNLSQKKENVSSGIFVPFRAVESVGIISEMFSQLTIVKKQKEIIECLKLIEPRLKDLTVQQVRGKSMIYAELDGIDRLIPMPIMGDGMDRALRISLAIASCENGIVCVDEIERGIYYETVSKIWKVILKLSKEYNVQVFATTHSQECIRSAQEAFQESKSDFRLHRLERVNNKIQVITYDFETMQVALEIGLEVR